MFYRIAKLLEIDVEFRLAKIDFMSWRRELKKIWNGRKLSPSVDSFMDVRTMRGHWQLGATPEEFADYACGKKNLC
tara:strand:- start:12 stop:239 length:228 start_codon:yes stop_codon:yes gene_type:complete